MPQYGKAIHIGHLHIKQDNIRVREMVAVGVRTGAIKVKNGLLPTAEQNELAARMRQLAGGLEEEQVIFRIVNVKEYLRDDFYLC